ncbi:MAG: hypothetical protein AUK47_08460 [Deltaproteobacteria bacterium CG2_30_63_29]|nr:MAG: hypothetical protein AUK47_08460 [Deltaproteobacteria bacterium CG2_30_63_29]PIV98509.1 MAG: hypothetical protein COW42_14250 [Deltaproteobacteria bacterium CG17_big_fil_post_rev_8_21_14_2_50_63_7]PJB35461.1 MAG: hypothetical protein CO108_25660 [Deltaproteobacteria bacterium CG_4_9_14_3_um_filter_63_12]
MPRVLAVLLAISFLLVGCADSGTTTPTGKDTGDDLRPTDFFSSDTTSNVDVASTDTTQPTDTVAADVGELPANCIDGQKRCLMRSYQQCQGGQFVEQTTCQTGETCVDDLGCVACNPTVGKVCRTGDVYACNPDGSVGSLVQSCLTEVCFEGACGLPGCTAEAQLVYVVDTDYNLMSFDPSGTTPVFRPIGSLNCPAGSSWSSYGSGAATPFSMSVDRSARAWILYSSGEIFWVNTRDAACTASPYTKGQNGYQLFGMGFSTDSDGSVEERLYIAGGNVSDLLSGNIGSVDPVTLTVTTLGPIPGNAEYSPELTGTGNGKLFGYFPGTGSSSFVGELNKSNGQLVQQWALPGLDGDIGAWAFAHWGGKFYIFVTVVDPFWGDSDSRVLRLDPETGQTTTLMTGLPYEIVGAGVSTCAPKN